MTDQPRSTEQDHDRAGQLAAKIAEEIQAQGITGTARSEAVTWTRAHLRDRIQRVRDRVADPVGEAAHPQTREPDRAPLTDWEGRAVTTTDISITKDMTPLEAANLLAKLEEGQQAAWTAAGDVPSSRQAEYQSRFQNAMEVDRVFHDLLQETADNGMRRPNEPVEEFAERACSDAWLAEAREAGALRAILDDPATPEGHAFAQALSQTAAYYARQKQQSDPLPEPDRTPGAPHPDPFLASRGWHMNKHGVFVRRTDQEPEARRDRELEAGA